MIEIPGKVKAREQTFSERIRGGVWGWPGGQGYWISPPAEKLCFSGSQVDDLSAGKASPLGGA